MMNSLDRSLRTIFVVLLVAAGAAFFYMAGLGTGMYVANAERAVLPIGEATAALAETPEPTQPSPTAGSTPATSPGPTTESAPVSFDIFWEVWGILQEEFYGDLPQESDLPYEAIRGVIAATGDQYTAFLDPERAAILKTDLEGSFEGIGATVRMRQDGKIEIVQPLAGWPAIKAGLRAQDTILKVDDVSLEGMTLYEAIALIRGPAGTVVRLLVERDGVAQPFEIPVERTRIEMPVVESRMLEQDIGYVHLNEFGQTATDKMEEALRELNAQHPKGLILDLRGNRGGYLVTSVEVTSQFVGQGTIVIERFKDGTERSYPALPGGLAIEIPLVVLVDGGSASASEITAGAIQDTERGVLIGTTTLGKGSVQIAHTLSDNSELRVTVARWFTPNGRAIHGEGLEPDIRVEITEEDILAGRDPQLDRATLYLTEGR
jgi:carboxyl-terminal processing protease